MMRRYSFNVVIITAHGHFMAQYTIRCFLLITLDYHWQVSSKLIALSNSFEYHVTLSMQCEWLVALCHRMSNLMTLCQISEKSCRDFWRSSLICSLSDPNRSIEQLNKLLNFKKTYLLQYLPLYANNKEIMYVRFAHSFPAYLQKVFS
jgi:hypothetical protein